MEGARGKSERGSDTTLMTAKSLFCKFKGERTYGVKKMGERGGDGGEEDRERDIEK